MSFDRKSFISILHKLVDQSSGFRASAFNNAIATLTLYNKDNLIPKEIASLKGIGKGVISRLEELIKTGKLAELGDETPIEEEKNNKGGSEKEILALFQGIYGVGPVTATNWYNAGHRTLKDILDKEPLSNNQKIGLTYYDDINSRIPRAEITEIESYISAIIDCYNSINKTSVVFKICGSYLRGKAESGDIDMIVSNSKGDLDINSLLNEFIKYGLIEYILAKGNSKILSVGGLAVINKKLLENKGGSEYGKRRRIDFELVDYQDWPYALLYFTGSKNLNKRMRQTAKDLGYTLNQEGLFKGGLKILARNEKEIFTILGLPYLTPEERNE